MNNTKLNGARFPRNRFKAIETHRVVENDALMEVLCGLKPALLVRGFLSLDESAALAKAYREHQAKLRNDGVPAHEVGVGAYGLETLEYFEKVAQTRAEMDNIYAEAGVHLPSKAAEALQAAVNPGLTVRAARLGGRTAAEFRAIHFCDKGPLALQPHDDRAQLTASLMPFEAASVQVVNGFNLYASTSKDEGGALRMWNMIPNTETKSMLGVERTGYPYAVELLDSVEFIDIRPATGDLLIFSADCIHAVTTWAGGGEERIVYQSFMGLAGGAVLRWT